MKLLVTGRSGTGKSTVHQELINLGFPAYDTDQIEDLASWTDVKTNQPVQVDDSRMTDKRQVGWHWQEEVFNEFMALVGPAILCGSADNQLSFYPQFDKVIVLDVPSNEQIRRIHARTEHDYGQAPGMAEQIVAEQAGLVGKSRDLGAIIMNADRSPNEIALDILRHFK